MEGQCSSLKHLPSRRDEDGGVEGCGAHFLHLPTPGTSKIHLPVEKFSLETGDYKLIYNQGCKKRSTLWELGENWSDQDLHLQKRRGITQAQRSFLGVSGENHILSAPALGSDTRRTSPLSCLKNNGTDHRTVRNLLHL